MPAGGGGGSSGPPGTIANKVPLALFDSSPRAPMAGKRAAYALRPGTRSSCSGRLFPLAALAGLAAMHYSNHRRKLSRFDCDKIAQQMLMRIIFGGRGSQNGT
uniref:Uncharacterized protein n=1 Tax=Oryza glumipatula TaxID=40148 RepID=A0A0E0A8F4_9ORYZ